MYYYFWFRLLLFRSPLLQESSFLSFPVTTQMFQFITFPLICYFTHILITNHFLLVEFPHSDICGYNGYLLLPTAFRSLSRPSSALGAQAFSLRSQQLNLLASSKLSFILCYIVINFSTVFAFLGFTVFQLLPLNCFLVLLVYLYLIYLYIFQCANLNFFSLDLVGSNGIEPSTSRLSGVRSNHLSYEPIYQSYFQVFFSCMSGTLKSMYSEYTEK